MSGINFCIFIQGYSEDECQKSCDKYSEPNAHYCVEHKCSTEGCCNKKINRLVGYVKGSSQQKGYTEYIKNDFCKLHYDESQQKTCKAKNCKKKNTFPLNTFCVDHECTYNSNGKGEKKHICPRRNCVNTKNLGKKEQNVFCIEHIKYMFKNYNGLEAPSLLEVAPLTLS